MNYNECFLHLICLISIEETPDFILGLQFISFSKLKYNISVLLTSTWLSSLGCTLFQCLLDYINRYFFLVVIQKSFSTIVYNKTKLIKDTIRLRLAIKLSRIKQNSFLLQHGIFYSCYIHQISHFKFPYIRYRIPT